MMLYFCLIIVYVSILYLFVVFVIYVEKINIKFEICFRYFYEYCFKFKKKIRNKIWEIILGVKIL